MDRVIFFTRGVFKMTLRVKCLKIFTSCTKLTALGLKFQLSGRNANYVNNMFNLKVYIYGQ